MPSVKEFMLGAEDRVQEEKKKKNGGRPTVEEFMAEGQRNAAPSARSISQLPAAMFTPQQDTNAAMNGVIGQLNKNGWNDWNRDSQYRRELGLQMISAKRAMKDYDPNTADFDAWWQHLQQEHYLEQMRQMEGIFQQRQQARDTFGSKANYDAYMGLGTSWEDAQKQGLTRKQWADEIEGGYQQAYTDIGALSKDVDLLEHEVSALEEEVQRQIDYYYTDPSGRVDEAAIPEDLRQKRARAQAARAELEQKRQQLETAYSDYRRYGFQRQFSSGMAYDDLKENEDWESSVAGGQAEVDELQQQVEAARANRAQETRMGNVEVAGLSDDELAGEDWYTYRMPMDNWTKEEKDTFAYLYHDESRREEAFDYALRINTAYRLNARSTAMQGQQDWAHDNLLAGSLAGAGSRVLTSPLGLWDWLGDAVQYANTGVIMPRSSLSPRDYANAWAGGAAAGMNDRFGTLPEDWAVIGGKGWGDAYQLGTSVLESMAWGGLSKGMLAAGGPEWLGAAVTNLGFFGNAASETTQDALARGVTADKAFALGIASGLAEAAGETFSIENLIHMDAGTGRVLVRNIFKQAGIESSEEAVTTMINSVADAWIMGDKSELNQMIQQNMLAGMSREEAERAAWQKWAENLAFDAVGGFLSGGVSGAAFGTGSLYRGSRTEYSGTDRQALLDAALQLDQKSPAYALAQKIQQNGTMSVTEATRLRELMGDTGTRVTDRQTEQDRAGWQQRAETALQASGVENPGAAAQLIAKQVMGEELSRDERRVLRGVQQAEQVSQALQEQRRTEESFRHITAQQAREEIREQRKAARKGGKTNAGASVTGSTSIRTADPNSSVTVKGQEGEAKIQNLTRNKSGELVANVVNAAGETQTVSLDALDYGESGLGELVDELRDRKDAPLMFAAYSPDMDIGTFINGWNVATLYGKNSSRASYESILNDPLLEGMSPGAVKIAFTHGRSLQQQEREQRAKERAEKEKMETPSVSGATPSVTDASAGDRPKALKEGAKGDTSLKEGGKGANQGAGTSSAEGTGDTPSVSGATPSVTDASAGDSSLKEGAKGDSSLKEGAKSDTSLKEGGKGGVSYEGGELDGYKLKAVNQSRLNPRQRAQIGAVDMFGKSLGVRFVLFESDSSNRFINGMYKDGVIYLDVNAGQHGRSLSQIAIVRTAAHELTHWMKDFNAEQYQELKEFLLDYLIEWKGKSLGDLAAMKMQRDRTGKLTMEDALDEVVADGCEMMLRRTKVMQTMAAENKWLFSTVKNWLQKWLGTVKEAFVGVSEVHEEARAVAEMETERLEKLVELWDKGLIGAAENAAKGPARTGGAVKYSVKEGMSEEERYDELKDRKIVARPDIASAKYKEALDKIKLIPRAKRLAEKVLVPLAEDLGILNRSMKTPEVDIDFIFSKNGGLAESMYRQTQFGGDYEDFAKALINIDSILEDAVLIERHGDKYKGTIREDQTLENVSVLLGAFKNGNYVIPVQFEIKKSSTYGGRLYMTVALTKMKADVLGRTNGNQSRDSSLLSASKYNIADVFKEIKPEDARFLKYVPDGFLNTEQKTAKQKAIDRDREKIDKLRARESDDLLHESPSQMQERDALPDDRELLMTVKAEGRNGELLEKHHKKVRALEALYRKLQRQQEALESAKKREVVDAEGKKLDPKQQKEFQRSTEKAVQEQIQKTEAQIRRAEQALDEMERSPQLRQELDKALAAWREANPTEAAKAIREMQQERESLKAYVKLLQQEAKLTTPENRRMLPSDVRKMAQALVKEMGSTAAVDSISEKLQELGDFMVSNMEGGDVSYYNRMVAEARKIAREIVEESYETIDDNKELREGIRGYLRGHTLNLEELRGEIPDLEAWRRSHMGTLRLGRDGMSIDQAYQDLRSEFGEGLFPSDVLSAYDQMQQILDALDRVQPSFRQMFSQYESWQAAEALGNEIIDRLLSGEVRERESMADRAFEQKMRQLEEKYARKDKARQKALEDAEDQMKWERARRDEAEERRREERALRRQMVQEKVHELRERSIERDKRYKARISIDKKVVSLSKIMLENSGKRHVPDAWKESIGGFLASIDTLTQHSGEGSRSFHLERIEALRDMVARQQAMNEGREKAGESQGPEAFIDVNPYLEEMLKPFIKMARDSSTGFITVENLELSQMRELEEILVALREAVDKADVMLADREKGKISENAGEFVSFAESRGKGKTGGMLRRFLSWDNLTPVYFFRRFGESGERVFRGLQRGWGKLAMNARQIIDYSEKSYSAKEAKAWEKETHEFKLIKRESDLSGRESLTKAAKEGGPEAVKAAEEKNKETVTLSTAQIMGLYCLSKREQARGHILAGGIRIWDINAKKGTVEQAERYLVSAEDLSTITGSLTERQREVADKLQTYMNTVGSAWGNEVSRARFGVDLFTEKNYYPIQTDEKSRNAKNPEADGTDLFHILNMGFTKNTVKNAKNGVVLHSIFDVFANHMADMAKYNAMGLPMLDAMKWFNYRDESGGQFVSVRGSMEKAFGKNAERYFLAFMQDLNGSFEGGRRGEDVASRMISHAKVASVGANLRVAALQPTSYVRALAVLDPKYLLKGENPARIRQGMREALQYSGTAVWKNLGFFDININANMRDMIKHTDGTMEKIREASMWGAELGDKMTWGKIWNACKAEVREKTGLSGEALLQAAAERFDDVIYQTQVMDSTMTRSHLMRQKGVFASMATSFMSEPILSYNLVLDAVTHWQDAKKRGAGVREAGKLAARAFITYGLSQIAASVVESFFSALRDDDDYEDLWEKWKQSEFGWDGNLMQDLFLHNKLPYVRDVVSILEGFTNKRMDTEWVEDLTRAYKALKRDFEEGELRWGTAYSVMNALSTMTGLPISNAARDGVALWNSIVVQSVPDWKLKNIKRGTVKPGTGIKQAYQSGALSEEDAIRYLMRDAGVESEEKARQTIYEWSLEKGEGKYDQLLDAVRSGNSTAAGRAIETLRENGYSESMIQSAVRTNVKTWYQGTDDSGKPRMNKQAAIDALVQYGGMRRREAEETVQEWTSYVSSPEKLQYEEIREAYVNGDISAERAAEMRVLFGGYRQADAEAEVNKWRCERETGIKYEELDNAYLDGEITQEEAVEYRIRYGGQKRADAEAEVNRWRCEKETGIKYTEIRDAYLDKEISGSQARDMMMKYGGKNEDDAEGALLQYDFAGRDPELQGISAKAATDYYVYLSSSGISRQTWYNAWKTMNGMESDKDANGKTVSGSLMVKRMEYIDSLNLTPQQKDLLFLTQYDEKNLRKTPWH